jgi:hypothetical protein
MGVRGESSESRTELDARGTGGCHLLLIYPRVILHGSEVTQ